MSMLSNLSNYSNLSYCFVDLSLYLKLFDEEKLNMLFNNDVFLHTKKIYLILNNENKNINETGFTLGTELVNLEYFIKNDKRFKLIKLNNEKDNAVYEFILSSVIAMQNYFKDKNINNYKINIISNHKEFCCFNYLNDKNIVFNRYINSKSFVGFEEICFLDKYFMKHYELDINNIVLSRQINKNPLENSYKLIQQYKLLISDLFDGIGKKRAALLLNKYASLEHMIILLNTDSLDEKDKKYINSDKLNFAIEKYNENKPIINDDVQYLFSQLK